MNLPHWSHQCTLWCLLANLSSTKLLLLLFVTAQLAISAIKHSCEVIFHYFKTRTSSIQLYRIDVAMPQPCSQAFTQLPFTCSTVKLTASDRKLGEGMGMRLYAVSYSSMITHVMSISECRFPGSYASPLCFLDFHCFPIQHKQCKKEYQQEKLQNTQQTRLVTCVPMEKFNDIVFPFIASHLY